MEVAEIVRFDGSNWTTYTVADGLLSNDGLVATGPDGTVWVAHSDSGARGY